MTCDWETATGLTPLGLALSRKDDSIALLLVRHGAKFEPSSLAKAAVSLHSLRLLAKAEEKARSTVGLDPQDALKHAWQVGTAPEILDRLIPQVALAADRRRMLRILAASDAITPDEKGRWARRLLGGGRDSGGHGSGSEWAAEDREALCRIASGSGDTTLLRGLPPENPDKSAVQLELNRALAGRARTLKSIDSLLALGADPLGSTGGGCRSAVGNKDLTTPLLLRRGGGCSSGRTSPFDYQVVARFLQTDPAGIAPELAARDTLFMAMAAQDLPSVHRFVEAKGIEYMVGVEARDALAFSVELGDPEIARFLLGLPFGRKEREDALERAVASRMPAMVRLLLEAGVDPGMPTRGGRGVERAVHSMLFLGTPNPSDTAIAGLLLDKAAATGRGRIRLPLSLHAPIGCTSNPPLFAFLRRRQPDPLDMDTMLGSLGGHLGIFRDSSIVNAASARGRESRILSAICQGPGGDQPPDPESFARILALLNDLLDRGVALDAGLPPDWFASRDRFQVGFDRASRRFVPVWIVPSLFSERGDFDAPEPGGDWVPASNSGWGVFR